MLQVNNIGKIEKWVQGQGLKKNLILDEVTEKELLLTIAAKLHSIRGMLIFFTFITVIGLIGLFTVILKTFAK